MWKKTPDYPPYLDAIAQHGGEEHGPYWETQLHFRPWSDEGFDERVYRLFVSSTTMRDACGDQGSPFELVEREEYKALVKAHHEAVEKVAELEEVVNKMAKELVEFDTQRDIATRAAQAVLKAQTNTSRRKSSRAPTRATKKKDAA